MKIILSIFLLTSTVVSVGAADHGEAWLRGDRKLQDAPACLDDPVTQDTRCMGEATIASGTLNLKNADALVCTSNDVVIAEARATEVFGPDGVPIEGGDCGDSGLAFPCFPCNAGDTLQVLLKTGLETSSSERRSDIGLWLKETPEGDAKSGDCTHIVFPAGLSPELGQLPDLDVGSGSGSDGCGDIGNQEFIDVTLTESLPITCGNGQGDSETVQVPYCIGWKIPGADDVCPVSPSANDPNFNDCELGTTPGTKSKCKCGTATLNILIQRCEFTAICNMLEPNDPVEGCSLTVNDGLPPAKTQDDVVTITSTEQCDDPTFEVGDWVGSGTLCGDPPLIATRTYTLTPPANAPDQMPITCEETVLIRDTTKPVIIAPADATVECPDCTDASGDPDCPDVATGSDNCGGTPTVTFLDSEDPGCGPTKVITRTWTATDECGNTATHDQTIDYQDNTPPFFEDPCVGNFDDVEITCDPDSYTGPQTCSAGDACGSADVEYCCEYDALNNKLVRTWTATDLCDNTATKTQDVVLNGGGDNCTAI